MASQPEYERNIDEDTKIARDVDSTTAKQGPEEKCKSCGFDWKTQTTVFGWPLLHVSVGRDERGRLRVAKGVFAVGQFAIGLVGVLSQFGIGLVGASQFLICLAGIGQFVACLFGIGQYIAGLLVIGQFAAGL